MKFGHAILQFVVLVVCEIIVAFAENGECTSLAADLLTTGACQVLHEQRQKQGLGSTIAYFSSALKSISLGLTIGDVDKSPVEFIEDSGCDVTIISREDALRHSDGISCHPKLIRRIDGILEGSYAFVCLARMSYFRTTMSLVVTVPSFSDNRFGKSLNLLGFNALFATEMCIDYKSPGMLVLAHGHFEDKLRKSEIWNVMSRLGISEGELVPYSQMPGNATLEAQKLIIAGQGLEILSVSVNRLGLAGIQILLNL